MIFLDNIEKVYQTEKIETVALSKISMTISSGEFVSIMGPSGSGKSTLLNIIGLLDNPSNGNLVLNNRPIISYQDKYLAKIRNEEIGFIFQSFHLVHDLNVLDNVEIPLLYRKISGSERKKLALEALERVGLQHRAFHFPSQLSGGQQQRVAIARAVVGKPSILLADEPTGNLDSQMGDEVMGVLKNLNEKENATIVMVTHDQRMAEMTTRIFRLFDGRRVN